MRLLTSARIILLFLAATQNDVAFACGDNVPGKVADLSSEETALLEITNAERKRANLSLFTPDPVLMRIAREHSSSMARLQQLSHTIEGRSFSVRLQDSGYLSMAAGENIAEGQAGAGEAVQDWMNSPGHRTNIMNGQYTQIGVASAVSKSGKRFYVQVFARPFPSSNLTPIDERFTCPSCRGLRKLPLAKGQERISNEVSGTDQLLKPGFRK